MWQAHNQLDLLSKFDMRFYGKDSYDRHSSIGDMWLSGGGQEGMATSPFE